MKPHLLNVSCFWVSGPPHSGSVLGRVKVLPPCACIRWLLSTGIVPLTPFFLLVTNCLSFKTSFNLTSAPKVSLTTT